MVFRCVPEPGRTYLIFWFLSSGSRTELLHVLLLSSGLRTDHFYYLDICYEHSFLHFYKIRRMVSMLNVRLTNLAHDVLLFHFFEPDPYRGWNLRWIFLVIHNELVKIHVGPVFVREMRFIVQIHRVRKWWQSQSEWMIEWMSEHRFFTGIWLGATDP